MTDNMNDTMQTQTRDFIDFLIDSRVIDQLELDLVVRTMVALDWKWVNINRVPCRVDHITEVRRLCWNSYENARVNDSEESYVATGGWHISCKLTKDFHRLPTWEVSFRVVDIYTADDE